MKVFAKADFKASFEAYHFVLKVRRLQLQQRRKRFCTFNISACFLLFTENYPPLTVAKFWTFKKPMLNKHCFPVFAFERNLDYMQEASNCH